MPTRVLLEGPAIEPLLAQVREEYGTAVRIVSAEKVRTGGLAGFFAKQRYELSVEVPDAPPVAADSNAPADEPATTLEDLLERAQARDVYASGPADRGAARVPTNPAVARDTGADEAGASADGPASPISPAATSGNAFATVMAAFGGVGAEQPAAARTAPVRGQPATPDNGAPAPSRSGPGDRGDGSRATRPRPPAVRPFRPATLTTPAVNGTYGAAPPRSPAAPPLDPTPAAPPLDATPAGPLADLTPDDSLAGLTLVESLAGLTPAGPPPPNLPATTGPAGTPAAPVRPLVRRPEPLAVSLLALGLPEPLAALVTGDDSYGQVLAALATLPEPPAAPDRAGEILVVAGAVAHALPVAQRVAEELRLDASRLLLAGPSAAGTGIHSARTISGPAEAQRKARRIHRADTPYVVVLDAPVTGMNAQWARDICDALGATAVWAVVDATRKTADTRNHLRALGDVEAIAVYGTADTGDPASVLHLGVPIVAVDGQPADRHTWAALLCERMAGTGSAVKRRRRRGR